MTRYKQIRDLFKRHPQSANSIAALILEIALSEDDPKEIARILDFARNGRSPDDSKRLQEDVEGFTLLEVSDLTEAELDAFKTESNAPSLSFEQFEGTAAELAFHKSYFERRGVIPATLYGGCQLIRDRASFLRGEFIENGRAYRSTYHHDVVEECPELNWEGLPTGRYERHRSTYESSEITWRDGDLNQAPPDTPPPYQGDANWDNGRCALFAAGSNYQISSDFGWRRIGNPPRSDFHEGVDLAVGSGVEVYAAQAGTITDLETTRPNGNRYVVLQSGTTGYKYLHIDPAAGLAVGQAVTAGTLLGTVSGATPGIHLHYSAHTNPPTYTNADMGDANATDPCP